MCRFEAAKQEGKSDEARVRRRQEAEETCAGDFSKRKRNGRGEGSGGGGGGGGRGEGEEGRNTRVRRPDRAVGKREKPILRKGFGEKSRIE